ncbi:NUDIX hydrolase [Sporolactobacillus nakayamae]|uniref:ADP-ribose pyrophosphatase YjhB, NUDIX family n=1 Tax=Sporolactobacillus nakayamae TaxID=269670 RepID=A0A1I2TBW5_9BACL|nr:NUDIX hydrolase [Sporolactobacillus nakayamae]SFG60787.1 ADP-ribose pyrophosphatase YjhB, NUDIX family [Sporolactobacillus nakayamae]
MSQQQNSYHTAFGCYGIAEHNGKMIVIDKTGGPYIHRYDLPGGSQETGESLLETLQREFNEETGMTVSDCIQIGAFDFFLPWNWKQFTHVHHVAVFYQITQLTGNFEQPVAFDGQDSAGAHWVDRDALNENNASPLVLKAAEWLSANKQPNEATVYKSWQVL